MSCPNENSPQEYTQSSEADGPSEENESGGFIAKLRNRSTGQQIEELELLICSTLANVLRIDPKRIGLDQSLISLGLDSLIGMNLRAKLESELGVEIPLVGFGTEPTVRGLAKVAAESFSGTVETESCEAEDRLPLQSERRKIVRARGKRRRPGVVALGGAHGKLSPLFCLHPVGGDLRCYDKLARHLTQHPVYGLRSHGLEAGSLAHGSMEQLVEDYAAEVHQVVNDGPLCLLGWSTGGVFAHELALRLRDDGNEVQALIMIDTPLPSVFQQVDLADNAKFLSDLVTFTNYFAGTTMQVEADLLGGLTDAEAIEAVLDLGIRNGVLPSHATRDFLHRLITVCKQHVRILQCHHPSSTSSPVMMIRPEDTSVLAQAAGQDLADDLGWGEFAPLSLHRISGHHFTMMLAENASQLADTIESLIRFKLDEN